MKRSCLLGFISLSLAIGSVHAQDAASRLAEEQAALSQLRIAFVQKVAELDSRVMSLEADLETNQQAFNDLKIRFVQEIASREDKIAELETQLANMPIEGSSAESATSDLANLQTRLADEQTALANLRIRFVQEIASREDTIAGLEAKLVESTAATPSDDALSNLQERLAAEQEALAQLRIRFVQEIANREAQLTELSQAPEPQNDAQLAILQNRLTEEQNALAQLRIQYVQEIADREAQIQALSSPESASNSQEIDALKARLAEEQEALAQLRVKFVQDVAAAQASNAEEGRIADLEAQIASLSAQLSGAQTQINALTTELSNAQNAIQTEPASTTSETTAAVLASSSYLVVSGDTLSSLALRFYGDSSLWNRIAIANNIPLETADVLEPGTLLVIPAQ